MKCLDCGCDEGTLLKEFQEKPEKIGHGMNYLK